jgi:hypothetical protein
MNKFIIKTVLISLSFVLIILIGLMISTEIVKKRHFNNYNTESNTLFLESNNQYEVMFMGISHARNFSRHKNHLKMEAILNSKIVNIGQGSGACGVNEQLFYFNYFLKKGNSTSKIIYVLSPPMLFSETLPIASNTFDNEAFEMQFFIDYLRFKSENKSERIISYLQRKLHPYWLFKQPQTLDNLKSKLDSLDIAAVQEGQDFAYSGKELNTVRFVKATKAVEEVIAISEKNNIEVVLLVPPALFGKWKGHDETLGFAKEMKKKHPNVKVLDGSETVLEPRFYYDNHHLNTAGIVYFTKFFLQPVLVNGQ